MYKRILLWCAPVILVAYFVSCRTIDPSSLLRTGISTGKQEQWLAKGYRYDENGWIFLHIEGEPYERGFQRGFLTANETKQFLNMFAYTLEFETGQNLDFFVQAAGWLFKNKVPVEYVQEMKGMVAGMERAGKKVTFEQMLFMNGFLDILWYWWPQEKKMKRDDCPGCSAFIATGEATTGGKIVMAHNSWIGYPPGRFANIIVDIVPQSGHRILMQSWGPCIYSATDFFITDAGIIGTETTIGGFGGFNSKGVPVFVRARKAMQYANNVDEWAEMMVENNSGAYANSWLLGDIRTGEIARLELGLKHHSFEKKKSGYFTGSNVTENMKILRMETEAPWDDVRDFCVARRVRWNQLMKEHNGKIDVELAKRLLADHYDVYLQKEQPTSRTICGHFELDDGSVPGTQFSYAPAGAVDGKVIDSDMARNWRMWAKWGSSCNIGFDAASFLKRHPQYEWLEGHLESFPPKPWTVLPSEQSRITGFRR
jgi:hypothetical protein